MDKMQVLAGGCLRLRNRRYSSTFPVRSSVTYVSRSAVVVSSLVSFVYVRLRPSTFIGIRINAATQVTDVNGIQRTIILTSENRRVDGSTPPLVNTFDQPKRSYPTSRLTSLVSVRLQRSPPRLPAMLRRRGRWSRAGSERPSRLAGPPTAPLAASRQDHPGEWQSSSILEVMTDRDERRNNLATTWFTDTSGIATGAAFGNLVTGPAGAVIGAIAGEALKSVFGEMAKRALGNREARRIGSINEIAAEEIRRQLDSNRPLRTDGFFDRDTDDRSAADEVFEGVLLVAQREHEEKKLHLLGKMMARFAFSPSIDCSECNFLIRLAERLSYRQFCLLSLFNLDKRDSYNLRTDIKSNSWSLVDNDPRVGVLQDILELHRLTLVQQKSLGNDNEGHDIMIEIFLVAPGRTHVVAGPAESLTRLADLHKSIPLSDLNGVATLLK